MNATTGVVQRSHSSTHVGMRVRSSTRRAICAGSLASAHSPPEIMLRVVSLPATRSWLKNISSSSSVSVSPSISTLASTEIRSVPSPPRRSRPAAIR